MESSRSFPMVRCGPSGHVGMNDQIAVEEPLEIRVDGHPVAVIMRTPGSDGELAMGFLITERIVAAPEDVRKIEKRPEENRILVFLGEDVEVDLARLSRHLFTGSSCGICGKGTLESIFNEFPAIPTKSEISDGVLLGAPDKLREHQKTFQSTGGLHAAGIFSSDGELLVIREDIGRHNAVDKVIGHALMNGIGMDSTFLLVSGRVSFEIMQKALAVGIPTVAAISAPSTLAVEFAVKSGQTLFGFLRPPTFNRYS